MDTTTGIEATLDPLQIAEEWATQGRDVALARS